MGKLHRLGNTLPGAANYFAHKLNEGLNTLVPRAWSGLRCKRNGQGWCSVTNVITLPGRVGGCKPSGGVCHTEKLSEMCAIRTRVAPQPLHVAVVPATVDVALKCRSMSSNVEMLDMGFKYPIFVSAEGVSNRSRLWALNSFLPLEQDRKAVRLGPEVHSYSRPA